MLTAPESETSGKLVYGIWDTQIKFKEWFVRFDEHFSLHFLDVLYNRNVSTTMRMLVFVSRLLQPINEYPKENIPRGQFRSYGRELEHVFKEIASIDGFWSKFAKSMMRDADLLYDMQIAFRASIKATRIRPDLLRSNAERMLIIAINKARRCQLDNNFNNLFLQTIERLEQVAPYYDSLMARIKRVHADRPVLEQAVEFMLDFRKLNKKQFPLMLRRCCICPTMVNCRKDATVKFERKLVQDVMEYATFSAGLVQIEDHMASWLVLAMGKHRRLGKDSRISDLDIGVLQIIWRFVMSPSVPFYISSNLSACAWVDS